MNVYAQTTPSTTNNDLRCSSPTSPASPASSTSSTISYFKSPSRSNTSSSSSPTIPSQIIVTFDGKVREMLRIETEADILAAEQRRVRRAAKVARPRYYAQRAAATQEEGEGDRDVPKRSETY